MDTKSKQFLYQYINNNSPVGYETDGQKIWLDYLKPHIDDWFTDTYGTAVAVINPKAPYKVVIEAHADEIAWYINYITKEGYMYVVRNGGSDYQIAPSMRAKIHADQGVLPGVFGWPAIHVRKDKEKPKPDIDTVILDGGFSSEKEVKEAGIHVGTIVTFDQDLTEINNKFWVGRALDNRMGGFTIAEVARRIAKKKLPFALYVVNAVQEEVGLKGAKMIAETIKPDLAIITDVTHDTNSPLYNKIHHGDIACGKGPVLSFAPAVQNNVREMLAKVAKKHKIPYQRIAASISTGTDTDAFAYAGAGIPSALISTPLKYMHTTVEMVHQKDVAHLIDWFSHFLLQLKPGHDFRYIKK
ncbi:MAG: M20/M25/M40 family metallo-hydrolase [Bacteroidota bacterium]